jgi:hypothetical protein
MKNPLRPLAWLGDAALKAATVERMRQHREADEFIQGHYAMVDPTTAAGMRGCFHGCLVTEAVAEQDGVDVAAAIGAIDDDDWWLTSEQLFGIPAPLGRLLDVAFEYCADHVEASDFAVATLEAIPVGADLWTVDEQALLSEAWAESGYDNEVILDALRSCPVPVAP